LITTIGCFWGSERIFSYYPGRIWSRLTCIITLCPVKITGKHHLNKKQSYIFTANHQGAYDIFLLYGYLDQPIKWIMKQSLRKIPFVGKACESAGFIFVDSSSHQAAARTIQNAEAKLINGASIVIFPEGSRTRTGKIGTFKKGAFQMAMDLKLPIVPITINGSFEVMPINSYFINPHKLEVIIHEPIPTDNLNLSNIREVATTIRFLSEQTKEIIEEDLWQQYKKL
jgi:1-acyl-sn-glycerol-3-phosphate acyltransferase